MINNSNDYTFVEKVYKIVKNGMYLEDLCNVLECSLEEAIGILELCKIYGKNVELLKDNQNKYIIQKKIIKKTNFGTKPNLNDLIHTKLCVVSDTHFGNTQQQLHLLNEIYKEAYRREIDTVLHCGDLVDGDYSSVRKEQPKYLFLHGYDEQAGYACDMYPKVNGIKTYYILGSHDETHYKNGKATYVGQFGYGHTFISNYPGHKGLISVVAHMGYEEIRTIYLQNGKIKSTKYGSRNIGYGDYISLKRLNNHLTSNLKWNL